MDAQESVLALGAEPLVEQAIYNLVDNAIRHGGGSVRISSFSDGSRACVVVSDDGPGVPESQRERIFERFYRIDPSRSRQTGGTGLGLAIVKHVAESMGGTISVGDSETGGAKFTLTLPAE